MNLRLASDITVPTYANASMLEIIWTIIGVLAIIVVSYNILDVYKDVKIVNFYKLETHQKAARILVLSYFRREIIRLGEGIIVTVIGILAVITPNVTTKITTSGLVLTSGIFIIGFSIGLQSYLDRLSRNLVKNLLREEQTP